MQILQMRASFNRLFSCSKSTDASGLKGFGGSECSSHDDQLTAFDEGPGALSLLSGCLGCS